MWKTEYDIIIVGAGVAGASLAYGLASAQPHLRICLLERSLEEPDRIVGELLQPGGVRSLEKLGMADALKNLDSAPVKGYCVLDVREGKQVHIPYPEEARGAGFHYGRFIQALRNKVRERARADASSGGVDLIEATVSNLITRDLEPQVVVGVRATRKGKTGDEQETFSAPLTIVADGCFSNFRSTVLGEENTVKPTVRSHFVGLVVRNVKLPHPNHGTVCLVQNHGPVLLYQIDQGNREGERGTGTRMLVDVSQPFPEDLKEHIATRVCSQLPEEISEPILACLADPDTRIRRMPNSFLPPAPQHVFRMSALPFPLSLLNIPWSLLSLPFSKEAKDEIYVRQQPAKHNGRKEGVMLVGDSYNMRHPLTGGGMTVALHDVVILTRLLSQQAEKSKQHPFGDWSAMNDILRKWYWERKALASTINILSVALYDLFGAEDEDLEILRTGCFKYFERGGACVSEPVSILSGMMPSPSILFYHFFSVAFYAIYILFTTADGRSFAGKVMKAFSVFRTACVVFIPLMWTEIRCWAPSAFSNVPNMLLFGLIVAGAMRLATWPKASASVGVAA
ncbi:squalene epoxidase-domain-containing protein [Schizophyllum amplum]|uniref:Squalene monooxygenase n=1 Tax=Schizophyllum amplum TaxID=97359 RepID=A0A550CV24_9AGAR|nr:squalene epoxidase-domain-containing protein [Auriculariopsis ampla]